RVATDDRGRPARRPGPPRAAPTAPDPAMTPLDIHLDLTIDISIDASSRWVDIRSMRCFSMNSGPGSRVAAGFEGVGRMAVAVEVAKAAGVAGGTCSGIARRGPNVGERYLVLAAIADTPRHGY